MASRPEQLNPRLLEPRCLGAPLLGIDALADRSELQLIEAGPSMRARADIVLPGESPADFFGTLKSYNDAMDLPGPVVIKLATEQLGSLSKDLAELSEFSASELRNFGADLPAKPWGDIAPIRKRFDQSLDLLSKRGRRIRLPGTRGRLLADSALDSLLDSSELLDEIDASRKIKERAELIALLRKQVEREPKRYIQVLENQALTFRRIARGLTAVKYVLLVAPVAPALYDLHQSRDNPQAREQALDRVAQLGMKAAAEGALDFAVDLAVPAIALLLLPEAAGFFAVTAVFLGVGIVGGYLVESVTNAIFTGDRIDADLSVLP